MSLGKSSIFSQLHLAENNSSTGCVYEFEEYRLDAVHLMLYRNGQTIVLKPKVIETLVALVESSGQIVGKDELMNRLWADSFVQESNLSQNIYLLRKTLGNMPGGKPYIETFWRRGYRFNCSVKLLRKYESPALLRRPNQDRPKSLDLQPVLVGSGKITGERSVDGSPIKRVSGHGRVASTVRDHLSIFVLLTTAIVAAVGVGIWAYTSSSDSEPIKSIAVMPFVNETGDPNLEYLSAGVTETLIVSLSRIEGLNVKARSSVIRYKGSHIDLRRIGAELGVQTVLTGRLIADEDDLAISWELIDTSTEEHLAGGQSVTKLYDVFRLQNDLVAAISRNLNRRLMLADEKKLVKTYTANPEAYQLYLKGKYYYNERNRKDHSTAAKYYQQAISLDPNFALAYAEFAHLYTDMAISRELAVDDAMPKARESVLRALELDESLPEAHLTFAFILRSVPPFDFSGAELEYKRALVLDPNSAWAHNGYGVFLILLGRHEEAFASFDRALEMEPLSLMYNRNFGWALYKARRYGEAESQLKKTLALDPNFQPAHATFADLYALNGRYDASAEHFARWQEAGGKAENAQIVRHAYSKLGWTGFLRAMSGANRPEFISHYRAANFFALLRDNEKALLELEDAFENREYSLCNLRNDIYFEQLQDEPRFRDLVRRVGFPE